MIEKIFKDWYFKYEYDDPENYISGMHMPEPGRNYTFIDCRFHPALYDILMELYDDSKFIGCNVTIEGLKARS